MFRSFATLLAAAAVTLPTAAQQQRPWLNTSLPASQRAHLLVQQMTLDEKAEQLEDWATAIPRLGIPDYQTWSEALHGVARAGYATVFPQAIGLAATWDTSVAPPGRRHHLHGRSCGKYNGKHSATTITASSTG